MDEIVAQLRAAFGGTQPDDGWKDELDLPEWFTDPDTPAPHLRELVADDPVDGIGEMRYEAADKLRDVDSVAFWLQAVGDGTPLSHGRNDIVERTTPFSIAHLSGHADALSHPEIADIEPHLFAHHLGMQTNPALGDTDRTPAKVLEGVMDSLRDTAEQQYRGERFAEDALQLPTPDSYEEERDRAIALLEQDELSMVWLQILCDEQPAVMTVGPDASDGEVDFLPRPIEWGRGVARGLDERAGERVALNLLVQHLFVAARTAGQNFETFGQRVLNLDPERHHPETEPSG